MITDNTTLILIDCFHCKSSMILDLTAIIEGNLKACPYCGGYINPVNIQKAPKGKIEIENFRRAESVLSRKILFEEDIKYIKPLQDTHHIEDIKLTNLTYALSKTVAPISNIENSKGLSYIPFELLSKTYKLLTCISVEETPFFKDIFQALNYGSIPFNSTLPENGKIISEYYSQSFFRKLINLLSLHTPVIKITF